MDRGFPQVCHCLPHKKDLPSLARGVIHDLHGKVVYNGGELVPVAKRGFESQASYDTVHQFSRRCGRAGSIVAESSSLTSSPFNRSAIAPTQPSRTP